MTGEEFDWDSKVFYFLMKDGNVIHVLRHDKKKFCTFRYNKNTIKGYSIDGKAGMVSMTYDLKRNYSHLKLWPLSIRLTEEHYAITRSDYFREAVRVAAKE